MTGRNNGLSIVSYVPHGSVPDTRGFAPSLVAYNLMRNFSRISSITICGLEAATEAYEVNPEIGPIYRIGEGKIYRRLFRKITKLDPYPLHARAANIVRKISPDIFHAHQLEFPVNDFLRRLGRRIPVVVHAHVIDRTFSLKNGSADLYVAVSEYVRDELADKGYPEDIIDVVRNGVETNLFRPALPNEKPDIQKHLNIPADAFVISFVGRMQEAKGFHIFLGAAEILLSKYPGLYVLAAGPEPDDARRDKSYGTSCNTRMKLRTKYGKRYREFPSLPHNELAELFKATDVALLPSFADAQGMVMIESMSSGCITVSSNLGGIKESISHGSTGFLLNKPDNIEESVHLIEEIIDHPGRYESIKGKARQFIVDNFDWKISASKMEKLYFGLFNNLRKE
ncbi:MAG: glycosyltransferase family 4 protein [Nitrospirae bacterium]|nr:glycosyltransferase family 4 protein [Nitrospirota bacterium]